MRAKYGVEHKLAKQNETHHYHTHKHNCKYKNMDTIDEEHDIKGQFDDDDGSIHVDTEIPPIIVRNISKVKGRRWINARLKNTLTTLKKSNSDLTVKFNENKNFPELSSWLIICKTISLKNGLISELDNQNKNGMYIYTKYTLTNMRFYIFKIYTGCEHIERKHLRFTSSFFLEHKYELGINYDDSINNCCCNQSLPHNVKNKYYFLKSGNVIDLKIGLPKTFKNSFSNANSYIHTNSEEFKEYIKTRKSDLIESKSDSVKSEHNFGILLSKPSQMFVESSSSSSDLISINNMFKNGKNKIHNPFTAPNIINYVKPKAPLSPSTNKRFSFGDNDSNPSWNILKISCDD